jgi:hypothetical protein
MDHPVTSTGKIIENSSWSCYHGITRWDGECGCSLDSGWKKPMRDALNVLADAIDGDFEEYLSITGLDPQHMRNKYIDVILGKVSFNNWWRSVANQESDKVDTHRAELLLRAQYERQRMFTSCGWFFGDLDRIELKNNISYAAHAVNLMKQATGFELSQSVLTLLENAKNEKTGLSAKDRFMDALLRFEK